VFRHAWASRLPDVYCLKRSEDLAEKMISLVTSDTNCSFKWYNTLLLAQELFIKVSMARCSHIVIFNFLQGEVVCFGTCFQVACLDRVYFVTKKCYLLVVLFPP